MRARDRKGFEQRKNITRRLLASVGERDSMVNVVVNATSSREFLVALRTEHVGTLAKRLTDPVVTLPATVVTPAPDGSLLMITVTRVAPWNEGAP